MHTKEGFTAHDVYFDVSSVYKPTTRQTPFPYTQTLYEGGIS